MKIFSIFSALLFSSNFFGNSLCLPINKKFSYGLKPIEEINNFYLKIKNFNNQNNKIQDNENKNKIIKNKKFNSFLKLIRYKNIFPTIYLF